MFDSGLGGLTVYREIAAARPGADFITLPTMPAFPYGAMAEPALVARVVALMDELIAAHRPDLIVIACNTASTIVLPDLRKRNLIARSSAPCRQSSPPAQTPSAGTLPCSAPKQRLRANIPGR